MALKTDQLALGSKIAQSIPGWVHQNEDGPLAPLGLCAAGLDFRTQGSRIQRARLRGHAAYIIFSGTLRIDDQQNVTAGSLVVSPSGSLPVAAVRSRQLRMGWLILEDEHQWRHFRGQQAVVLPCPQAHFIECALTGILTEVDRGGSALAHHGALAVYYCRQALSPQQEERHDIGELNACWQAVRARPADHWTVAHLADMLGQSEGHTHRRVQQLTGCTPIQMVTRLRMEAARDALLDVDMTIAAVAKQVGFGSARAFALAFRRETGESPSSYRSRMIDP